MNSLPREMLHLFSPFMFFRNLLPPFHRYSRCRDGAPPTLWLEEVASECALDSVKAQNKIGRDELTSSTRSTDTDDGLLEICNLSVKITDVTKHGERCDNFWQDAEPERGIC